MDTTQFKTLLEDPQAIAVLGSASAEGQPNVAVFGSPRLLEDGRLLMALGDNRTWACLQQNRHAVLMVFKPAAQVLAWRGVRAYLELEKEETQGPLFQALRAEIEEQAGVMAARAVRRAVIFQVTGLRPLLDMPRT